jgi:hypothetical protein
MTTVSTINVTGHKVHLKLDQNNNINNDLLFRHPRMSIKAEAGLIFQQCSAANTTRGSETSIKSTKSTKNKLRQKVAFKNL